MVKLGLFLSVCLLSALMVQQLSSAESDESNEEISQRNRYLCDSHKGTCKHWCREHWQLPGSFCKNGMVCCRYI